jgi:hypothetical protein
MRSVARPRRYVARHWILLARPVLRYSVTRQAFVLRVVGRSLGPVLRADRRHAGQSRWDGFDRRGAHERPRALTL